MEAIRSTSPEIPTEMVVLYPNHRAPVFTAETHSECDTPSPRDDDFSIVLDSQEPLEFIAVTQKCNTVEHLLDDTEEGERHKTTIEQIQSSCWQTRKRIYSLLADCMRTGKCLVELCSELTVFEFIEP